MKAARERRAGAGRRARLALVLRLGEAALRGAQRGLRGRQAPLQALALALRGVAHLGARRPSLRAGLESRC